MPSPLVDTVEQMCWRLHANFLRNTACRFYSGGLLGTIAITFLMYFVAPFMLGQPMDVAKMLGKFLGTTRNVGMAVHYINGTIIFPLIFAWILWTFLPGG